MKKLYTFLLILASSVVNAQHPICGYDYVMAQREAQYPGYSQIQWEWFRQAAAEGGSRTEVLQIPVVFHIVWNEEIQNIPDEVIFSQIEVLNQDFRRLNADADQTREEFLPVAADAQIEFFLATEDPDGQPTNGITRTFTERTAFEFNLFSIENTLDEVKFAATGGVDAWDTDRYMNVWICNVDAGIGLLLGLAYPPEGAPNWPAGVAEPSPAVSGIILHYTAVGLNNPAENEDNFDGNELGRTLTHEVGHYLGLRHIWGDGFGNGCSVDDGHEDTPNCSTGAQYVCNFNSNSCNEGEGDLPDMIENYMDYNRDDCQNLFTQQQVDVMRWVIENLRPGLIEPSVGVDEARVAELKVYPNPSTGIFNILRPDAPGILRVRVYDQTGRRILDQNWAEDLPGFELNLSVQGIYLLEVIPGQGAPLSSRLVVH